MPRSPEQVLTPLSGIWHALGGKAGNEAVAQVAHAADVDVAHRVVVGAREDGAAPMGPRPAPGWPASGSWSPRRCPKKSQTRP